jgi:hypothetical protein
MKNFVLFLAIGLLAFSLAVIGEVAQASRLTEISGSTNPSVQNGSTASPAATEPAPVIDVIDANLAGQTAVQATGFNENFISAPILVSFEGKVAYQVALAGGYNAYVDAVNGSLLYNPFTGDASTTISSDLAIQAAAQYLKNSSVINWGVLLYEQLPAYAVGFVNGDVVLVNPHGQVVYVQQANSFSERGSFSGDD